LAIFTLAGVLSIFELWFGLLGWYAYSKVMITLGLIFLVVLGVALARREYLSDNQLRDDGYID
jgi:hypothetical protein